MSDLISDPTSDLISRQAAIRVASGYCHPANVAKELAKLPSAQSDKDINVPSNDCISRQAAIDAIEKLYIPEDMCVFEILSHIELAIGTLPSAQPERKPGRWIPKPEIGYGIGYGGTWSCSECGEITVETVMGKPRYRFCPMCGVKMEQPKREIPTHCGPKEVKGGTE